MKSVEEYLTSLRAEYEKTLAELVAFPTVSMELGRASDIQKCADYVMGMFSKYQWDAKVISTPGNPVLAAEYVGDKSWKTVLLYNHLDVQPVNHNEWLRTPFVLTQEGDKYFGRGATDDKGPALTLFFAACFARELGIPVNFQILWELEEEIGSPNFEEALKQLSFKTRTDSVMISDGLWISETQPSTEYGLRGGLGFSMQIQTAEKDAHSGIVGGFARNPVLELSHIIAACCDENGYIKIPGFYNTVRPVGTEEITRLLENGFSQEDFKRDYGLSVVRSMSDEMAIRATKTEPTFEVVGISGGYQAQGIKTIVPYKAEAKISIRLVPDQTVQGITELVTMFIKGLNDRVELSFKKAIEPYVVDPKGPHIDALRRAVQISLGKQCLLDRSGGSIGVVATMRRYLKAPIIQFGLSLPPHGYHAKNEYFEWNQVRNGVAVFTEYFKEIAKL